jgi:anti-sigma factor RsiW
MECLDEETVLAFAAGDLPEARRKEAQEHIAQCDECRALVSAVARSSFVDKKPSDATQPDLGVSAAIGATEVVA